MSRHGGNRARPSGTSHAAVRDTDVAATEAVVRDRRFLSRRSDPADRRLPERAACSTFRPASDPAAEGRMDRGLRDERGRGRLPGSQSCGSRRSESRSHARPKSGRLRSSPSVSCGGVDGQFSTGICVLIAGWFAARPPRLGEEPQPLQSQHHLRGQDLRRTCSLCL